MAIQFDDRLKLIGGLVFFALAVIMLVRAFLPSTPAARKAAATNVPEVPPVAASRPRPVPGRSGRRYDTGAAPANTDPKLRLDLLAKVAGVNYSGTERNIFQYQAPPPPPPPTAVKNPVTGPGGQKAPTGPPPPPPPPAIPLKYYGYAHKPNDPVKRAFFMEGEDIFIAGEGEIIKKRYKVVKIGVNTVEMEDLVTKSRQTLPLQES